MSLAWNIYQYARTRSKLKLDIHASQEVNEDLNGTYLAARITISNTGSSPAYFSGLKAVTNDDYFFPSFSLAIGTKIEANNYIDGTVPIGHIIDQQVRNIIVIDGLGRQSKLPRESIRRVIGQLKEEKTRLESLGFHVHPRSKLIFKHSTDAAS